MSKIKSFLTIILSTVLVISSLTLPTSAAFKDEDEIVAPMYTNASRVDVNLSKENGKVVIRITVVGYSGTTFSAGEIALFKTSGSDTGLVKSWDRKMSSTNIFTFTDNSTTATTGSYKVTFSIKALRNGVGETITGSDTI